MNKSYPLIHGIKCNIKAFTSCQALCFIISLLTFVVCLQIIKIEVSLPVSQHKGQEGEDEGIQDAHDGQHIGPAYRAITQGVFSRLLPAHITDHLGIPSIREDHATQHQAYSCSKTKRRKAESEVRIDIEEWDTCGIKAEITGEHERKESTRKRKDDIRTKGEDKEGG